MWFWIVLIGINAIVALGHGIGNMKARYEEAATRGECTVVKDSANPTCKDGGLK